MADLTGASLLWVLFASGSAIAAPRSNGNLKIEAEVVDAGGGTSSNGSLINIGSLGGLGGLSSTVSTIAKQGFVALLYEVKELQLSSSPTTVAEEADRQISAILVLDDDSYLPAASSELLWSVQNGPLSIDNTGLATGLTVYQDSPGLVQADRGSITSTLGLTVINTLPDNFGSYAGDGIDDDWQAFYFGLNNPLASPTENPDFDSANNLMEFLTGYDPTDSSAFFDFSVISLAGTTVTLELSKIIPGTRYRIEQSDGLSGPTSWNEITSFTTGSEILQHLVTDPASPGDKNFYRVSIEAE